MIVSQLSLGQMLLSPLVVVRQTYQEDSSLLQTLTPFQHSLAQVTAQIAAQVTKRDYFELPILAVTNLPFLFLKEDLHGD